MNNSPYGKGPRQGRGQCRPEIICKCNNISRDEIEQAIRDGASTLNEIFDATTAGVGPCGGSCRRILQPMLEHYLETGTFPEARAAGSARRK